MPDERQELDRIHSFLRRGEEIGWKVFSVECIIGAGILGARYGYILGEYISPDLDGIGEVIEHGLEVATATAIGVLSTKIALTITAKVAEFGFGDIDKLVDNL